MTSPTRCLRRRDFLRQSAAAAAVAGFAIVPRQVLGGPGKTPPSEKVNLAHVGVGKRGQRLLSMMKGHNIVALCDVDARFLGKAAEVQPHARTYRDFRKLLDKEGKHVDAVVVATPDHIHAVAAMAAIEAGKHVYCEKPLAHDVFEVRRVTEAARNRGLATQLGTGAHAGYNFRRVVELVRSGAIGDIGEVHVWCDEGWPPRDRPKATPPVPEYLLWDLWLGPAPYRPYHPCYHPVTWRSWWDFGNGRLGDMGCHLIDLPFWALELKYPLAVEAEGPPVHPQGAPLWLIARWTFPARGKLPPVKLTWYDNDKRPPQLKEKDMPQWPQGVLFIGSRGMLVADYGKRELRPRKKFDGFRPPPRTIPESPGHAEEWLLACKTGSRTLCNFDYSGPLVESVLLGTVAYRTGRKLQWDAGKLKAVNCPEADRLLHREYRNGWRL